MPKLYRSGGMIAIMNCSGFMLTLEENVHRETPTGVIETVARTLTSNAAMIKYFNRIRSFGWDMACKLLERIISLIKSKKLSHDQKKVYTSEFLSRMWIDKMHIQSHKCQKYCSNDSKVGLVHPGLPKFQNVLSKVNGQIVEQTWKKTNRLQFMKKQSKEHYRLLLLEYKDFHNEQTRLRLENDGFSFVSIDEIQPIRDYQNIHNFAVTVENIRSITTLKQPSLIKKRVNRPKKRKRTARESNTQPKSKKRKVNQ